MQKDYLTPSLQIFVMTQEDVITASVTEGTGFDSNTKDHILDWSEAFN